LAFELSIRLFDWIVAVLGKLFEMAGVFRHERLDPIRA
jgi:hypothetical protein